MKKQQFMLMLFKTLFGNNLIIFQFEYLYIPIFEYANILIFEHSNIIRIFIFGQNDIPNIIGIHIWSNKNYEYIQYSYSVKIYFTNIFVLYSAQTKIFVSHWEYTTLFFSCSPYTWTYHTITVSMLYSNRLINETTWTEKHIWWQAILEFWIRYFILSNQIWKCTE